MQCWHVALSIWRTGPYFVGLMNNREVFQKYKRTVNIILEIVYPERIFRFGQSLNRL